MIGVRSITLALLFLLAGCTPAPRLAAGAGNEVTVVKSLPTPMPRDVAAAISSREFVLGPLDKIKVQIFGFSDFDTETQIDNGGKVQLPLVGAVSATGKSIAEFTQELNTLYARTYIRNPQVSVALQETKSLYVAVEGAVRQPGIYPAYGALRLNGALALAQGLNEYASYDNVAVFRMINGKQNAAIFNLRDIRSGKYAEPEVFPNDTIIVGESAVRRAFRDIIQTAPFVAVFRPFG